MSTPRCTNAPRSAIDPARRLEALVSAASTFEVDEAVSYNGTASLAVIEGELVVEGPRLDFDSSAVDAVLAAFIDDQGRLVPARTAEAALPGEARSKSMERARALDDLRAKAFADRTLRSYGSAVKAWREWCLVEGRPALPFDPEATYHHLLDYAFEWDGNELVLDEQGNPVAARSLNSVQLRLAGLNKAAEFVGVPRPGDNEGVQEVMRGVRRAMAGGESHKKAAIDLAALHRCLVAAAGTTFAVLRSQALVLVRARTGASSGQLMKLNWVDISLTADQVVFDLAPDHRGGDRRRVAVAKHNNPELCLVRVLTELRRAAPALHEIFTHIGGEAMSRTSLYQCLTDAAKPLGGWKAVPDLTDRQLPALLAQNTPRSPLAVGRDRALLLLGWWSALRRSNLSALNWGDLTDHGDDGFRVAIRFSKTDQEGKGDSVWIPHDGSTFCPATALRVWLTLLTDALGRPPAAKEPVFAGLTPGGGLALTSRGLPTRLSRDGINDVVQTLAIAAGLAPKPKQGERCPYGAHSLRIGFVTEALRDDKLSVPEVADVTKHKSLDVLFGYRREVNSPKSNPARKLMGKLGRT